VPDFTYGLGLKKADFFSLENSSIPKLINLDIQYNFPDS